MRNPYSKYKNKIAEKLASGKTKFKGETRSKGHRGSFYIDKKLNSNCRYVNEYLLGDET